LYFVSLFIYYRDKKVVGVFVRFSLRHFNYAKADARGIEIGWLG
jgi:hypothetical protein